MSDSKMRKAFLTNYILKKSLGDDLPLDVAVGDEDDPEARVTPLDPRHGEVKAAEANLPHVEKERSRFEKLKKVMGIK